MSPSYTGGHGCQAAADDDEGSWFGNGGCAFDQAVGEIVVADVSGSAVGMLRVRISPVAALKP